jgi:hypothetical protein
MKTFFLYVSKLLAGVFAFLAVLIIPVSLMTFNIGRVVFSPEIIKDISVRAISETDFISLMMEEMSKEGLEGEEEGGEEGGEDPSLKVLFENLEDAELQQLRETLLPDALLAEWVEEGVDSFYRWLESKENYPQIRIDISQVSERMKGPQAAAAAEILFESLPPCTDEQLETFESIPSPAESPEAVLDLMCKAPTVPREEQIQVYEYILERIADEIPQEVNLSQELRDAEGMGAEDLARAKETLRTVRRGTMLVLLLPGSFLLLVTLFGVRSLAGFGGWWGIPILLGSGISFTGTLIYPGWIYRLLMNNVYADVPSAIQPVILHTMERLSTAVILPLRRQSLAGVLIGALLIGLMLFAVFLKKSSGPSQSEPAQTEPQTEDVP